MTDAVGAPTPEVYRLSMEKLPLAMARARRIALVQALASVTVVVTALKLAMRGSPEGTDVALSLWGITAVGLPYVLWKAGLRVRRRWNAFELSIGPNTLRCAARGSGRITMRLDELTSVTEGATGLVVRASAPGVVVRIPRFVEGFLDVRRRLGARREIAARPDALVWCAALVGAGVLAAATVSLWGRSGCVATGVLASQAAAAFAVAAEVRWHPRLSRGFKLAGLIAVVVAVALPTCWFAVRALASL